MLGWAGRKQSMNFASFHFLGKKPISLGKTTKVLLVPRRVALVYANLFSNAQQIGDYTLSPQEPPEMKCYVSYYVYLAWEKDGERGYILLC